MLQSISWQQYITFFASAFLIYYVIVIYLYFKMEVLSLFGISVIPSSASNEHSIVFPKEVQQEQKDRLLNTLKDELQAYVVSVEKVATQQELLNGLGYVLNKYPSKLIKENKSVLKQLIITECNTNSITCPEQSELDVLWKQAE